MNQDINTHTNVEDSEELEPCYFDAGRNCSILTKKRCTRCAFYVTESGYEEKKQKASERIKTLSIDEQQKIKERYRIVSPPPVLADFREEGATYD